MFLEGKEHLSLRLRNFQFIPSHQKRQKMKVVEILTKSHCGNRRQIQRTPKHCANLRLDQFTSFEECSYEHDTWRKKYRPARDQTPECLSQWGHVSGDDGLWDPI